MLQWLGRPLQRVYSSFNSCSSAPKGGWVGIEHALVVPKLPIISIFTGGTGIHPHLSQTDTLPEPSLDGTTRWRDDFRR